MKLAQVRNVPEIRFKIFGGYWSFKRLGYFASQVKKKNYDQAESYVLTNSATYGIVGQEEYFDREIARNENLAKYYVVHIGDFIYNPRKSATASAGPIKRNRCAKGVISPIYTVFRFSRGNLDFFEHYFNSTKWHRHMKRIANYGARFDRLNITRTDFFKLPMPCISEEEQQKIATFLSSVDTKIEQLCEKKELLELYKKGMMQKLFDQDIRFKDEQGNDYPDWEEKLLGDISNLSKGKGISKTDIKKNGTVKCIRYGELYTRYGETISNVLSSTNVPISELVLSQKNDVIIPASGETTLDIASAACITIEGVALGGDINIIRCQQNGIFLAYYLNSKKLDIARLAQGVSIVHLYSAQLASLNLRIPFKQEQQKIADFLSAIDKKIELVATQLGQARTFKKGLLQQMFI